MPATKRGRPVVAASHNYFNFDEEKGLYTCKVGKCNASFQMKHAGAFKAHLRRAHPKVYEQVLSLETTAQHSKTEKENKTSKIHVALSAENLQNACVNLVTVNGRPLSLMQDSGFREIIDPIIEALKPEEKITISPNTVKESITTSAVEMKEIIKMELKNVPFLCVKVDVATRYNRSFLAVNVQFIENAYLKLRTLSVKELTTAHTGENLKNVVKEILKEYDVSLDRIYTFTSDNGSNMIKMISLCQEDAELMDGKDIKDRSDLFENEEEDEELEDTETTDPYDPENIEADDDEEEEEEEGYDSEDEDNLSSTEEDETDYIDILTMVRCGVHTQQLAVQEVLKKNVMKKTIAKARKVVKALRTDTCLKPLKMYKVNKPILDVPTRWNSTVDMLISLTAVKEFCKTFPTKKKELHLSDIEWKRIEECIDALKPCKIATLKMQNQNLLPGEFFGIWHECKRKTESINTNFASKLVKALNKREKILLSNEALLSSMFLDPRYLPFLSEAESAVAKQLLRKLWLKLQKVEETNVSRNSTLTESTLEEDEDQAQVVEQSSEDEEADLLDAERRIKDSERLKRLNDNNNCTIDSLLLEFEKVPSIATNKNLLMYWETKKHIMPELYKLSKIVHAVPMTQVSVERLFSGMRFIFSTLRANLSSDVLNEILIIRANKNFKKEKNYLTKLKTVQKRTGASLEKRDSVESSEPTNSA